ncbi:FAS1-like dehydratase domain-containing protein [Parvularcula marina]|uniref:Acyl-CoA dehydrogenase n=1 Tax=Parvularcula marina TaxID=2292771 RepID=A0A371RLL3_9PROT|nr:MaoC family dehydratase N-terminal domain-containing protein [Parvularcula marina]RFB06256.1 acyl-CoA dehydrogenase [Parvularcula marina]
MSTPWDDWIGKTERREEQLDPARARALQAAMGHEPNLEAGDPLPPLFHWIYFWEPTQPEQTGADGHPKRGLFLPPIPAPRRMWASGKIRFHAELLLGEIVQKQSTIEVIKQKQGRTGPLTFVTVRHVLTIEDMPVLEEDQVIVYREAGAAGPDKREEVPLPETDFMRQIDPDTVLLFRYSALTLNSHRIHYDRPYAMVEEGYEGLVVHGPLQATLLADLVSRHVSSPLEAFEFKGVAPAFDGRPLTLNGYERDGNVDLVAQQSGHATMTAKATPIRRLAQ